MGSFPSRVLPGRHTKTLRHLHTGLHHGNTQLPKPRVSPPVPKHHASPCPPWFGLVLWELTAPNHEQATTNCPLMPSLHGWKWTRRSQRTLVFPHLGIGFRESSFRTRPKACRASLLVQHLHHPLQGRCGICSDLSGLRHHLCERRSAKPKTVTLRKQPRGWES